MNGINLFAKAEKHLGFQRLKYFFSTRYLIDFKKNYASNASIQGTILQYVLPFSSLLLPSDTVLLFCCCYIFTTFNLWWMFLFEVILLATIVIVIQVNHSVVITRHFFLPFKDWVNPCNVKKNVVVQPVLTFLK